MAAISSPLSTDGSSRKPSSSSRSSSASTGADASAKSAARMALSALPVRRALLREGQRTFLEVLGGEQAGDRRIAVLALDRAFQAGLVQAPHHRLLGGADRHRAALADQAGP